MEIATFTFPDTWTKMEIYPLSDLHIGDPKADIKMFRQFVANIKAEENRYIVCVGDLLNNAIKTSISNVYNETMSPRKQVAFLAEELEPIKDRILCMVEGNHEYRSTKDVDQSPSERLAEKLGCKHYYQDEAAIKISLGKGYNQKPITYTIYLTHGASGGKWPGNAINNTIHLALSLENCDIVIVGHSHKKVASKIAKRHFDVRNNVVRQIENLVVVSSHWSDLSGYAARKMLLPSAKGTIPIILDGRKKEMLAVV